MRFSDYFAGARRPVISFEVFPPKDDAGMERLRDILPELLALQPAYMTCTYGAMGTTRSRTLEIASYIRKTYNLETASHLTCVGSSRAELDQILDQMRTLGIRNIVALRGDPPKGETKFTPPADGLAYANEMVEHIRAFEKKRGAEPFGIAVGGYPEKHVDAPSLEADLANLKRKVDAGADLVITQLFYDNADYFRYVEAVRALGVTVPIVPGLLPVLSARQIKRIASLCGARIPAELLQQLDAAGDDDAKAERVGIDWCAAQSKDLLARGAPGIHYYVLNKFAHVQQIVKQLPR
ncbi:MAG: methylenetetrahydrofolate reductase [NAD(P)H] [Planctomycetota bacterium]|nr:methylenetetrahydrofolate reductase [NAD(P)H] [Planctomycetota bacterium]